MPTLKWATDDNQDIYRGGDYAGQNSSVNGGLGEGCALNYQESGYQNSHESTNLCGDGSECNIRGFCANGSDCTLKTNQSPHTNLAFRWFDIDGDGLVDIVASIAKGGIYTYNLQQGNGIRFRSLTRLELAYLSKLEVLSELDQLPDLRTLDCDKCRKLRNHEIVQDLDKLQILRFNECGEIPTLKFLNRMAALEEFRFVDTNILDGNLRPLLRLKRVGFLPKRHYSHTPEQIDALLSRHEAQ